MSDVLSLRRWFKIVSIATGVAGFLFVLALCVGYAPNLIASLKALLSREDPNHSILIDVRLPRVLLGFITGAALSLSGALLQTTLHNPLAEPYLLGVSSGGTFGATLASLLGATSFISRSSSALAGALLAITIVYLLASSTYFHPFSLILIGVAVNAAFSSLVLLLTAMLASHQLQQTVYFLMGTLTRPVEIDILLIVASIVAVLSIISILHANHFNALLLGDETAQSSGVNVKRLRALAFIISSILAAFCVSLTGLIGFVGLLVPHLVRLTFGSDHRILLVLSAVSGGAFLVVCDAVARSVPSLAIPVGVLTALCGSPILIILLWRQAKRSIE